MSPQGQTVCSVTEVSVKTSQIPSQNRNLLPHSCFRPFLSQNNSHDSHSLLECISERKEVKNKYCILNQTQSWIYCRINRTKLDQTFDYRNFAIDVLELHFTAHSLVFYLYQPYLSKTKYIPRRNAGLRKKTTFIYVWQWVWFVSFVIFIQIFYATEVIMFWGN